MATKKTSAARIGELAIPVVIGGAASALFLKAQAWVSQRWNVPAWGMVAGAAVGGAALAYMLGKGKSATKKVPLMLGAGVALGAVVTSSLRAASPEFGAFAGDGGGGAALPPATTTPTESAYRWREAGTASLVDMARVSSTGALIPAVSGTTYRGASNARSRGRR